MLTRKKITITSLVLIFALVAFILLPAHKGYDFEKIKYFACECKGFKLDFDKCLGVVNQCRYFD